MLLTSLTRVDAHSELLSLALLNLLRFIRKFHNDNSLQLIKQAKPSTAVGVNSDASTKNPSNLSNPPESFRDNMSNPTIVIRLL